MKKLSYIFLMAVVAMAGLSACSSDDLTTDPTNSVSGSKIFSNVESAQVAINGIYRLMYYASWSENWPHENCGEMSIKLVGSLMADDQVMYGQGNGWYYEDYRLNVHGDYTTKDGRSYAFWNYNYTLISNANYIIASEGTMSGSESEIKELVGQALAVRANAYFNLIQLYQQTYKGNETAPGIPVYTEPTAAGSVGKSRGTVQDVYTQIDKDLTKAIEYLGVNKTQSHISHIDYYVANGIKARVSLVENKWGEAASCAAEALKKPSLQVATLTQLGKFNSTKVVDVMWGAEIIADQSSGSVGFLAFMDAGATGEYGYKAQQCISSGLYNLIPSTDARKAWWNGALAEDGDGSDVSYCNLKFRLADRTTRTGDYIFMRAEEMILIKAEAECHDNAFSTARTTLSQLGDMRDTAFATRLAARTDAATYNSNTNAQPVTLMDEILLQRRIELWSEVSRIFDLQRLGLGYSRVYAGSNHTETVAAKNTGVASPLFIMPLPQSEIDGNSNITAADNNPIVR